MLELKLPEITDYPSCVFRQDGEFVIAGHRETCESVAEQIGGLYCLIVRGQPVVRIDFSDHVYQQEEIDHE